MPVQPGETLYPGDINETRTADTSVDAGDCVRIAATGEITPAASGDTLAGIAKFDEPTTVPENVIVLKGVCIANVNTTDADAAVTEGVGVAPSGTAGELGRPYSVDGTTGDAIYDQPASALALSDEGGAWSGHGGTITVPEGYAVVYVRHALV
jgi:hypothetical protein